MEGDKRAYIIPMFFVWPGFDLKWNAYQHHRLSCRVSPFGKQVWQQTINAGNTQSFSGSSESCHDLQFGSSKPKLVGDKPRVFLIEHELMSLGALSTRSQNETRIRHQTLDHVYHMTFPCLSSHLIIVIFPWQITSPCPKVATVEVSDSRTNWSVPSTTCISAMDLV